MSVLFVFAGNITIVHPQSIKQIDARAEEYYSQRELSKAIAEWLKILEIDPENEEIQRKIERVYEEKHRKDMAFQRSKLHLKLAKRTLYDNLEVGVSNAEIAISNYFTAYRIDPQDPEIQALKDDMRELDREVKLEQAKKRLSEELKKKYFALLPVAREHMDNERYQEALQVWEEILSFVPIDTTAKEGKRQAELAIKNRLKFEKIKGLLAAGTTFFNQEKYNEAKQEFEQVLNLDPENDDAEEYLSKIRDIQEEKRNYEQRRMQAEQFYLAGLSNINAYQFDQAEENLENALALIDGYKDARARLDSLPRLRKQYQEQQRRLRLQNIDRTFQNGLVALSNNRYRDAIASFEATLSLDPKNELAKRYLETAQDALRQQQEEVVDENSPYYDVVEALIESGKRLYDKEEYMESRQRWEKILRLFPQNRIATEFLLKCDLKLNPASYERFSSETINEGRKLLNDKKYKEALKKFELIYSISPDYSGIESLINRAKRGMRRSPAGVNPGEVRRRYRQGLNYYQRGGKENLERALEEFRWIVARDPNNTRALININKIQSQLRQGGSVTARQSRLTERQKELVREYYFRGINYYSQNEFARAITEWRKVLAIDPNHEKARNNIRKSLVLLGR
ncbi:MAG: tetratricopeptide repeat protein [bacterium]